MKKYFFTLFAILSVNYVFCQTEINNSLQINPIHFTNFPIGVAYQRALNNYFNLETTLSFSMTDAVFYYDYFTVVEVFPGYYTNVSTRVEHIEKSFEYGLGLGLVYRPFGHRLKGFYLELLQGVNIGTFPESHDALVSLPTEFQLGYQWLFKHGITISPGIGLVKLNKLPDGVITIDGRKYETITSEGEFFDLFYFRFKLGIGYSW
jgi:hypothetical protein